MGLKYFKTSGIIVLAAFIMPCGVLLAKESNPPAAATSSNANWYDVEQASDLFSRMTVRAREVRQEVGPLQVQGYALDWRDHAARLVRISDHINDMGRDLQSLDQIKGRLEPWQQNLVAKVTPNVHGMVYQTDQALTTLASREDPYTLRLTDYPNNIDQIYRNADRMINTIQSVTKAAHGEQMSALRGTSTNPGS